MVSIGTYVGVRRSEGGRKIRENKLSFSFVVVAFGSHHTLVLDLGPATKYTPSILIMAALEPKELQGICKVNLPRKPFLKPFRTGLSPFLADCMVQSSSKAKESLVTVEWYGMVA